NLAVALDRQSRGRAPRVGDECGEASSARREDHVGRHDVVGASAAALVCLRRFAGRLASVRGASLIRRAGAERISVAVDERVEIARAVGSGAKRIRLGPVDEATPRAVDGDAAAFGCTWQALAMWRTR